MALQFNVTSVDAAVGQRQPISTGFEQNRQISNQDQIWPLGQPNPAGTNSSLPVAFEIQANVLAGVTLRGNFNFDAAWRAPGSMYTVSTTAPGAAMFRSARSLVPIDPADNTVIAQQFTMLNPLAQAAPFKCTGDWTWTITHINPNGPPSPPVNDAHATRIEAYFFIGPILQPFQFHVAEFLRLFMLTYNQVLALADPAVGYAEAITIALWALGRPPIGYNNGLQYDCRRFVGGAPRFLKTRIAGGRYSLNNFMRRYRKWCNCFDLAALVELACKALGQMPGPPGPGHVPFLPAQFWSRNKWGYIPAGPLFGWNFAPRVNCNSPFWKGVQPTPNLPSNVPNGDPTRTLFNSHAWIETTLTNQTRVLEICHGLLNGQVVTLQHGQSTRAQFYAAGINNGSRTANFPPFVEKLWNGVTTVYV